MNNETSIARIPAKPAQTDEDDLRMLDQLEMEMAPSVSTSNAPKSKEAVLALLAEWKTESPTKREQVVAAAAEDVSLMQPKQTPGRSEDSKVQERPTPDHKMQTPRTEDKAVQNPKQLDIAPKSARGPGFVCLF